MSARYPGLLSAGRRAAERLAPQMGSHGSVRKDSILVGLAPTLL
jgi:hypothetical protein